MHARRFPWAILVGLWFVMSAFLLWSFWQTAVTLNFDDPDDFLRLQQVRDFLGGQSWFDLTQRRLGGPGGLPMHWSRLVDVPLLAFMLPLRPLLGQHMAEVIAVMGAPLLTLLALITVVVLTTRRLFGPDPATAILACLLTLSASTIFAQIHPGRIDHHGWQIVFAAAAVAALLQRNARRSGLAAGVALAFYLNISIEGAPFVAAALGITGLLWALGRDKPDRVTGALASLAITTPILAALTAPAYRWTEGLCDAVMPSHMLAMVVAAAGTMVAGRIGARRGPFTRVVMLAAVLALTILAFGLAAPTCVGSPFGQMDPVVDRFWYQNVVEGMPVWRQDAVAAAAMIGFPILSIVGSVIGLRRAGSPEMRRRWTMLLFLLIVTLVTGALVRRAAGVSHVIAVPGALVLIGIVVRYAEAHFAALTKSLAIAFAVIAFSPIMPVFAVAAFTPSLKPEPRARKLPCDRMCVLHKLATRPPEAYLTRIDLGPLLLFHTPHSAYGAGYHRLGVPLRDTIDFFQASPEAARAFMERKQFRVIMIAPASEETKLFVTKAPRGMMARLVKGPVPDWLVEDDLSASALRVYRRRD